MRIITATDLQRFMACNGSRLIEGFTPSIPADDTMREEGNAAHWLIKNTYDTRQDPIELIERKAPNGFYITGDMTENIEAFLTADPTREGKIEIETSFGGASWRVNARADRIIHNHEGLYVDDFKYGWGIVEPEENWTLIAHALGYCIATQSAPTQIIFRIYQPRPHHPDGKVREWRITYNELLAYYERINATLTNPSDMLMTGYHCKNCPGFVNCPAARKAQMNAIDVAEMAFDDVVDNDTLSLLLDQIAYAVKTLETAKDAYKDLALHRVRLGQNIRNYSIENDLTNTQWKDGVTVELIEVMTGRQDLTKKQLITPTQAMKAGADETTIKSFSERKNKGIKLVRVDENKKAQKAFGNKS